MSEGLDRVIEALAEPRGASDIHSVVVDIHSVVVDFHSVVERV
ncbi:hypothetical protein HEP84_56200 [Streptomyces sp. RLB1-33]|nr:hypothetical protein [Streptomyces sp. RLB1-33]